MRGSHLAARGLQASPDPQAPSPPPPSRCPLTSPHCPPCQAPGQAHALCVLFVLLRVSVGSSVGVCCTPADGRQHALPTITPPQGLCGSRRHRQNKSLAAEQPVSRHLLSNPSPDIILTKFLLTPPASGTLPAWLPSVWSPPTLPPPSQKTSAPLMEQDTLLQKSTLVWGGGWGREVINIWTLGFHPLCPLGTQRSDTQKLLTKGKEGTALEKVEDNAHAQNSPQQ